MHPLNGAKGEWGPLDKHARCRPGQGLPPASYVVVVRIVGWDGRGARVCGRVRRERKAGG